jgi:SAM-dependent methyltransferase
VGPQVETCAGKDVEIFRGEALAFLEQAKPDSFDFVLASNFFEHLDWRDLTELLPLLRRAIKPGGRLAVVQPNFRLAPRRYFDDYTHRTVFTDTSLADWLAAGGFDIVRQVPRFLPLTVKSKLGGLSFLVPIYLRLPWRPLAGQMFVLAERPAGRAEPRRAESSALC